MTAPWMGLPEASTTRTGAFGSCWDSTEQPHASARSAAAARARIAPPLASRAAIGAPGRVEGPRREEPSQLGPHLPLDHHLKPSAPPEGRPAEVRPVAPARLGLQPGPQRRVL